MEENVAGTSSASSMMPQGAEPRICPVCSSVVKLFAINFHVKFLMCENTECIFPFGYEELYFEEDTDDDDDDIVLSSSPTPRVSTTDSVVPTSGWSERERVNKVCNPVDYLSVPTTSSKLQNKVNKKMELEKRLQKNVEELKQVSLQLSAMTKSQKMHLQKLSVQSLVQQQETEKSNQREKVVSELKIDIEPGTSGCMASINIQFANEDHTDNESQVDLPESTLTLNVDEAPNA